MWLKAPSGGRLLIILNPFESCTRSSSVSSESQGTPAPLKSLLRDHNGGGWEGGQNPGATIKIKSPVKSHSGSSCSNAAPSHLPHPCICPRFSRPAGKLPVPWAWAGEWWENARFTFASKDEGGSDSCFNWEKNSNPCPNCPNVWLLHFLQ